MKKTGIINRAIYVAKQGRKGYQLGGPPVVSEYLDVQADPQQDEQTYPYAGSNYQPAAIDKAMQKVAQTSMPAVQTARGVLDTQRVPLSQDRPVLTPKSIASSFVPPEQQGAVSPSMEGVMEGAAAVGRGFVPAMQATGKYITSTGPRQFASDIGTVAGHMVQAARENPAEFIGGMLPGIGNIYSLRDIDELKGKIATARAAGDEETALKLEKFAPLAAVGAAAPFGAGAAVGAVTKAAERAAIKSVPRELSPLGLYSYGVEAASMLPQAKGTPEQIAAMLQRQGVKPEELFMSGFADEAATNALRSKIEADFAPKIEAAQKAMENIMPGTEEFKRAERLVKNLSSTMRGEIDRAIVLSKDVAERPFLTREETTEFFKGRVPQVEEKILGQAKALDPEYQTKMDKLRDESYRLGYEISSIPESDPRYNAILDRYIEVSDQINELKAQSKTPINPPKYEEYTLPGGENYREVLLKLPDSWQPKIEEKYGRYGFVGPDGQYRDYWSLSDAEHAARSFYRESGSFKSTHWSYPDVLAHIRMADRIGPNGEKILHVEELQSDWAQKAQKIRMDEIKRVAAEQNITKEEAAKLVPQDYAFSGNKERLKKLEEEANAAAAALKSYTRDPVQERELVANYDKAMENYNAFFSNISDEKVRAEMIDRYEANTGALPTEERIQEFFDAFKKDRKPLLQFFFPEEFKLVDQVRQDAIGRLNEFRLEDPVRQQLQQQADDAFERLQQFQNASQTLPKNQYVSNTAAWTDLVLKRVLKEAAEGGYDKVVWTPGVEQAKRYDLSKHVDRIAYDPEEKQFMFVPKNEGQWRSYPNRVEPNEIENIIGKEHAKKLLETPPNKLSGIHNLESPDFVFGGEGMKGYYDKIVPTQLAKLTRKLDPEAKIERLPIYQSGKKTGASGDEVMDTLPATQNMSSEERANFWGNLTQDERNNLVDQYIAIQSQDIVGQGLTITPRMREAILGGLPYYAGGGMVKKSYPIDFSKENRPVVSRALMLTSRRQNAAGDARKPS